MATDKLVDFDHVTDYISREAAIDAVDVCNLHRGIIDALQAIISDIPSADVRPVVRGHYVGEYDGYADGNPVYDMWYCSECGCFFEDWDEKPTYNFCPNCGADMREVDNG